MKRFSFWILAFSFLTLVLVIGPAFLGKPLQFFPLMHFADLFDLLTPLILIPLYWLLFRCSGKSAPELPESLVFMVLAALWVQGQGIHLAANSIGHQLGDPGSSAAASLTYFYDEHLGHYLWHLGLIGLAVLLILREWRAPSGEVTQWGSTILAGFLYGFTLFTAFVEGQTVLIGLPFALTVTILSLGWGRRRFHSQPILAFFSVACLLASILISGWGLFWRGFPGFWDAGILR